LEKDPLYEYAPFKMNENNTVVSKMQDKFSLKQYYATYHKNSNFFKNNIFNLIFDTFKGITPRQYHDFAYVHDLKTVSAIPLTQKFLLQEIYEFSKIHKNANISSEMLSLFVPNSDFVGKDHISILDGNKVLRIEKRNGKWPDIEGSSEQRVLELFRVLTDIDLLTNPVILNHSAFSQEKILHVIHAILNIHNSGKRDQVLSSKKALGDTWNKYAAEGVNVNSILIGMGE
jgi:hypothetical protein